MAAQVRDQSDVSVIEYVCKKAFSYTTVITMVQCCIPLLPHASPHNVVHSPGQFS